MFHKYALSFLLKYLIIIFLSFSISTSTTIDSLKNIAITNEGFPRAEALRKLSTRVRYEDKELSIRYADSALKIFKDIDSLGYAVRTYINIGHTYRHSDDYDTALKYYNKALSLSLENEIGKGLLNTYNSIGNLYNELDQDSMSLIYYNKSYGKALELKDTIGISNAVNNIGILYWKEAKLDSSLKYIKKS